MKHFFILNPAAGNGRAKNVLKSLIDVSKRMNIDYVIHRTVSAGEATKYVLDKCEELGVPNISSELGTAETKISGSADTPVARFYAIGGDGTAAEVLQGLIGFRNIEMTIVPAGSGNDFVKNFPSYDDFNIEDLIEGETKVIDVIDYNLLDINKQVIYSAYALNLLNMGFDAEVVEEMMELKKSPFLKGKSAYVAGVAKTFIKKKSHNIQVSIFGQEDFFNIDKDSEQLAASSLVDGEHDILLLGVANGKYSGGGFKNAPNAIVDDGLLEFTGIKNVSRVTFMRLVKGYHDGTYMIPTQKMGKLLYARCTALEVFSEEGLVVAPDGEVMKANGFRAAVCPSALSFVVPRAVINEVK